MPSRSFSQRSSPPASGALDDIPAVGRISERTKRCALSCGVQIVLSINLTWFVSVLIGSAVQVSSPAGLRSHLAI